VGISGGHFKHLCRHCGSAQVCRSRRRGIVDTLLTVVLLRPYRCLKCDGRSYQFSARAKSFSRTLTPHSPLSSSTSPLSTQDRDVQATNG
jgi:hypothetical protein